MQTERRLTYQARCAIQALKQTAYALGALALGHATASATAWATLATSVAAAVKLGRVRQEFVDAIWIEPYDPLLIDDEPADVVN